MLGGEQTIWGSAFPPDSFGRKSYTPTVSLYLELTPERRVGARMEVGFLGPHPHQVFRRLTRLSGTALTPTSRIFSALDDQLPELGRGAAFFACWGRSHRMLVALLSREQSRFFVSHLGTVEEIYRVKGQRIRGMLTDRVPRDRRDALANQLMKDEAKALASMTEAIGRQLETSHFLYARRPI
jgi:peptide chain release factor subunit 1